MQIFGRIHLLCTIFSKSLAEIGVTEMPRMSLDEEAFDVLGIAVSLAVL